MLLRIGHRGASGHAPENTLAAVVRASAQFYLRAVEGPAPYQQFFRTLEQAVFLEGHAVE